MKDMWEELKRRGNAAALVDTVFLSSVFLSNYICKCSVGCNLFSTGYIFHIPDFFNE
jgi:hypothetical protein